MLAAADAHGLASDVRRGLGRDPARDAMAYPLDQAAAFFAAGNLDGADEELGRAEAEISRTVSTYEARARRLRDAGVPCADAERSAAACRGFRARVGALREFSHYRQAGGELAMLSRTCTELEQAAGNSGIGHAAEAAGIEGGGRRATMAAFSFGRAADSLLRAELAQARDILLSAAESFDLAGAGLREAFRNGDTAASAPRSPPRTSGTSAGGWSAPSTGPSIPRTRTGSALRRATRCRLRPRSRARTGSRIPETEPVPRTASSRASTAGSSAWPPSPETPGTCS